MSDCPHCGHGWSYHAPRCTTCGCQWQKPVPPPPPPTARELLVARVNDAIWEGFEAEDNACVDREMDLIDTGGSYETFSMERVAQHVLGVFAAWLDELYESGREIPDLKRSTG